MKKRLDFNFSITFDEEMLANIRAFCKENGINECCPEHKDHHILLQVAHVAANELARTMAAIIDVTDHGPGAEGTPIMCTTGDGEMAVTTCITLPKLADAVAVQ